MGELIEHLRSAAYALQTEIHKHGKNTRVRGQLLSHLEIINAMVEDLRK